MGDIANATATEKKSRNSFLLEKKLRLVEWIKERHAQKPKTADVSWNKPLKARFQALYDQWMLDGVHETTAPGNPKPPPPELYL
ncbi:pogo transposable element with KRAB domain-like protein [Aphelenchoides avenae]|nr:pogo transposable element with KRAB domain-like protein [Aphelenchus avenae]